MNKLQTIGAGVLMTLSCATTVQAAEIQFSGLYSITDDVGPAGVSPGDSFDFNSISVTFADPIYAPEVVGGSPVGDFSITAMVGANIGTFFSVGLDTFTITSTTVAATFGPFTLLSGGLGTLNADDGSWYLSFLGNSPSGGFQGLIETPPGIIPMPVVPLPAALPLLVGALGGLAFLRRRRN
jgi:hypothetical protein